MGVCVCVCVRACVRAFVRAYVCVCCVRVRAYVLVSSCAPSATSFGLVCLCVCRSAVCFSSFICMYVLAQRIRYRDYTIWVTHQGIESRITTFRSETYNVLWYRCYTLLVVKTCACVRVCVCVCVCVSVFTNSFT